MDMGYSYNSQTRILLISNFIKYHVLFHGTIWFHTVFSMAISLITIAKRYFHCCHDNQDISLVAMITKVFP